MSCRWLQYQASYTKNYYYCHKKYMKSRPMTELSYAVKEETTEEDSK